MKIKELSTEDQYKLFGMLPENVDISFEEFINDIGNDEVPEQHINESDVNNDGDTDLYIADTTGDGDLDTAVIAADSPAEEKEAIDTVKDELGLDNSDKTSVGKDKGELEEPTGGCDYSTCARHSKQDTDKQSTFSNIVGALLDRRY